MERKVTIALSPARRQLLVFAPTECLLGRSAHLWFLTAAVGQWVFVYYLFAHYVHPAVRYGLPAWADYDMATGYRADDTLGNAVVAAHIFLAIIVISAGQLQLVPHLRSERPAVHRWSGRVYVTAALIVSLAGLYMVWVRGNPQVGIYEQVGTTLGALLIVFFGANSLLSARARRMAEHRLWALRLYMVVSGVWFIRVGYGLWFQFGSADAQHTKLFSIAISYGQYVVPLGVLELYVRVRQSAAGCRAAMAIVLMFLSVLTALGTYQAFLAIWWPRMHAAAVAS